MKTMTKRIEHIENENENNSKIIRNIYAMSIKHAFSSIINTRESKWQCKPTDA